MNVDDLCMGCMEARGGAVTCVACGWEEGAPTANPVHLPPRSLLRQHYVLGRVLGHGGFGIAYLAWDPDLQMKVAVKEYLPGDVATRGSDGVTVMPYSGESRELFEYGLTKFLEEGRAVVRFHDHPGIASMLGFFREHGTGYLVMQYLDGLSFMEYLKLKGPIAYDEAVAIAMPVLDTLRVVHEGGLLHRDISPHNIYITKTKQVKLLDFGAARHALGDRSKSLSVILKAGYSPFEQYLSKGRQGPWTDVYAVAATIYRAITGDPPPEATARVVDDELVAPRARGVRMPVEAEGVLLKAMAVDQKQRFQSAVEFQQALLRATPQIRRTSAVIEDVIDDVIDDADDDQNHNDRSDDRGDNGDGSDNGHGDGSGDGKRDAERGKQRKADPIPPQPPPPPPPVPIVETLRAALRIAVDRLESPAQTIDVAVRRTTGLSLAPDVHATARPAGLAIGLAAGLLGVWGGISLFGLFASTGLMTAGAGGALVTLRVVAGTLISAAMALGGAAGLTGDARGAPVLWSAIWSLLIITLAGIALQSVVNLPQTGFAFLPAAVSGELAMLPRVVVLPLLAAGLLALQRGR
jgi:serine/threonine protein kinase